MLLRIASLLLLFLLNDVSALSDFSLSETKRQGTVISGLPQEQKPSRATISGTIHLNGKTIPDSFYVGIKELQVSPIPILIRPKNSQTINLTDFSFGVAPGLYTLVVSAFGYETLSTPVLVPDTNAQVDVTATLEPMGLKPGDQWVKLWGDFCRWRPWGAIEMVQRDSVWVLPGKKPVKVGEGYRFILSKNGSDIYDLRHSVARPNKGFVTFNSIYQGGEIVFDPSHFLQPGRDSNAEFSGGEHQAAFAGLVDEMNTFQRESIPLLFGSRDTTGSSSDYTLAFMEREERFRQIANRYPAYFEQFFLRMKFDFLKRFHPHAQALKEMQSLKHNKQEFENKRREHYQSSVYESYFSLMAQLAKKMDPNSIFFRTYDTITYLRLDEGLHYTPHLGEKYNVPAFFFTGILVKHERGLPSGSREGARLLWRAAQSYRNRGHHAAARNTIRYLSRRYPNSRTVTGGSIERMLNALDLREESVAPEFVAPAVGGDSLRLSDFRGKFVFLDFWATWCGPCVNELPNLKKLHQSFPEGGLRIIGLAHDDPRDVEDFIRNREIPYVNGISDKKIEQAYGIVAWPTTFLIAPDGEIIAKNLRGERLVHLVKEKISAYNAQ
ncbi:MAG: redoxin domain-containing protein [Gemmatimonadota bacterium]|nr:redoxin domain-containing protein [Gemmatimonadota bacterium]